MRDNWITRDDPGFVDAARGHFGLRPDSPAVERIPGFPAIPFEDIGLRRDEFRRHLPTPAEAGRLPEQNPFTDDPTDTYFGT